MNEPRIVAVWLDLLPKPRDGVIDRAIKRRVALSPELSQQLVSMDNYPGPLTEILQNFKIAMRQP